MESVAQNGIEATPEGTADAALSALWMTTLLNSVAVDAEFEARDLEVTDEQREQVAASYESLDDLPEYLVDMLIEQQARAAAVAADAGKDIPDAPEPTDAELSQLYEENKDTLAACASGKEVSHILVADEATATQIAEQLEGARRSPRSRRRSRPTRDRPRRAGASVASVPNRSSRSSRPRPTRRRSTKWSVRCRPSSATTSSS